MPRSGANSTASGDARPPSADTSSAADVVTENASCAPLIAHRTPPRQEDPGGVVSTALSISIPGGRERCPLWGSTQSAPFRSRPLVSFIPRSGPIRGQVFSRQRAPLNPSPAIDCVLRVCERGREPRGARIWRVGGWGGGGLGGWGFGGVRRSPPPHLPIAPLSDWGDAAKRATAWGGRAGSRGPPA